jgi:MFS family permease
MSSAVELKTITTDIPARLDRLPWAKFHWLVVIGLGAVWTLDGLEVTIVGSMSEALNPADTGLGMSNFDIGLAGAVYVAGGCLGALVFGQLTDRFGRKKLFLITLAVYTIATVLTAFSPSPLWYFACRFLTAAGIGGEYAAINSAIDELIPAHYRGRVDIVINGSFWIGAVGGALLTIPLLDPTKVDPSIGWRLAFGLGAILALGCSSSAGMCPRALAGCSSMVGRTKATGSSRRSRNRCAPRMANCRSRRERSPCGSGARSAWR